MTLSARNTFFKVNILFCAISTLVIAASSFLIVPSYSTIEENTRRSTGFFQGLLNQLFESNYYAVHTSMVMAAIFSLVGMYLIYSFFEQTPAPEILYFALFVNSFSFETIRLIMPMYLLYNFPSLYLLIAGHILLFARTFGVFALFSAGICAAGLEVQRTRTVVTITIVAALALTMKVPIDTQYWSTSLNFIFGYSYILKIIEIISVLIAVISFFISVNIRGSKEYRHIGIGLLTAVVGRYLLFYTDNWAGVCGIFLLSFGTWYACSKLHKIYLWL